MLRKIQISSLMLFSFIVIIFGGYNCSQVTELPNPNLEPSVPLVSNSGLSNQLSTPSRSNYNQDLNLPSEPTQRCHSSDEHEDLKDSYAANAFIRLNTGNFREYRFGRDSNYEVKCPRIYLNLSGTKRKIDGRTRTYFRGKMAISYIADNNAYRTQKYDTGYNYEQTRFNTWEDDEFRAFFDNSHTAVILKIDSFRTKAIADGQQDYVASGSIYFKNFRSYSGDKNDVCYRKGSYAGHSRTSPSKNKKCWLLNIGPFSCKPLGVRSVLDDKDALHEDDYDCYDRLGKFQNLNLLDAFDHDIKVSRKTVREDVDND